LYTGLNEETFLKIETKDENISIKDLRIYCEGLDINLKSFFNKNYSSSTKNLKLPRVTNRSTHSGKTETLSCERIAHRMTQIISIILYPVKIVSKGPMLPLVNLPDRPPPFQVIGIAFYWLNGRSL
jgi:hypothetical protein